MTDVSRTQFIFNASFASFINALCLIVVISLRLLCYGVIAASWLIDKLHYEEKIMQTFSALHDQKLKNRVVETEN